MPRTPLNVLDPWYADGLRFTCTQCGNCCTGGPGYVWISDEEIDRLAKHLGLSRDETLRKHCRTIRGQISLKERRDHRGEYPCIFLTEQESAPDAKGNRTIKRGCAIYPVRPLQCRTWPFWDGNLASREDYDHVTRNCPGTTAGGKGKGRLYSLEQIVALRDAEDWPDQERTPSSLNT